MKIPLTNRTDRIYIIPTKAGGIFLASTLAILLIGSGFSNNLVNLLAFFMFSLIFVGMVLTNLQVKELILEGVDVEPAYAEGELRAHALFKNPTTAPRIGIKASFTELKEVSKAEVLPVIRAQGTARIPFVHPAGKRGRYSVHRLQFSSIYPLGLFYTWKVISIDQTYLVYPKPESELPLPERTHAGEAEGVRRTEHLGGDDFRGHRAHVAGDSFRHVDWKAFARGRPLLVKELNEGEPPDLVLDWHSLGGMDSEKKLSQLCAWVQEALQKGLTFKMVLPDHEIKAGAGWAHARVCLEALALYPVAKS